MFYAMFIILIFLLILIIMYDITRLQKFMFIKSQKRKLLKWIISLIPFFVIFLLFNYINFIVIIVHLALFMLLSEFLFYLIKKIFKIKFDYYYAGIMGVLITVIYLGIGMYLDYHVFHTYYSIYTEKNIGSDNFRIIQISDSHIGTTFNGDGFKKHIENIMNIECDIVVITGDYVDDDTKKEDMIKSTEALSLLSPKYGIYYINGNHDKGYFNYRNFSYNELKDELQKRGVIVLEDDINKINDYIYIVGRNDRSDINRKSINDLVKNIDKDKYIIDLNHQPNDYANEMNKVDLVLSGHTHGGQLFPLGYIGLVIGFNDEFYGLKKIENTNFIVNSGISDWAIDFKTGTFSEIGIIDIKSQ